MPIVPASPSPDTKSSSPWLAPLLVFGLALLVMALLLGAAARSMEARDRAAFEAEATRTADAVRERIDTTVTLLHGVAGLLAANGELHRDQFGAYVGQLDLPRRHPGMQGLGWSARLDPRELEARTAQRRSEGDPGFQVWPAEPREEVHAILYLEPRDERNLAALGYDMFTEPTRRAAMARARDEGRAAASGKVTLVQEIDENKQSGFLIYLPVYRGHVVPATVEQRRRDLLGFVYTPSRIGDLLQGVRGTGVLQVDYALYDGDQPLPDALMRSTRATTTAAPAFTTTRRLDVAGRTWLLAFSTRPGFEAVSQRRLLPWLAGVSLAVALLLAGITFVQARARRAAEAAAAQRRLNELALQASEERERERAQRLQELYAELREGDRRKDEFLAVLAHELRNPLAPIRNSLELLRRVPDGPPAQRAREIAERQVRHMVRLVDDLLDVSRISRGKIVLQRERTPLHAVLESAVETSRPLIEQRRHRLHVGRVDPALELDVDAARLAQIFTNLLNNAAHYTPEGGEIEIAVRQEPGWVRVAVRDNGIGIEPAKLRQVFDLFAQVEPATGGGLGIGLSLSARLAELHGGRIEAHSEGLGRGAEFVVVLPRPGTAPGAASDRSPAGALAGGGRG